MHTAILPVCLEDMSVCTQQFFPTTFSDSLFCINSWQSSEAGPDALTTSLAVKG